MRLCARLKEEMINAIPAIIYFVIAFNLLRFSINLSLRSYNLSYYGYGMVTLAALVTGKMLVLVELLPFFNAFPQKPLIYNIIWKFCLYGIAIFLFRIVDSMTRLYFSLGDWHFVFLKLKSELLGPLFWSTQMWLLLVFLIFVIFSEYAHALGRAKVLKMLLG